MEDKVYESDFFLEKLNSGLFFEARYYLSAFLSSSRSITFALQASLTGVNGFEEWYQEKQEQLRNNSLARFFVNARNESQKIGLYHLNSGKAYKDENGNLCCKYYFVDFQSSTNVAEYLLQSFIRHEDEKMQDVGTLCRQYLTDLIEIVFDCFSRFGSIIDPDKYYSLCNLKNQGKTIEDIEEELGFPRGFTNVGGNENDRLKHLRKTQPGTQIDRMFQKHLNKTRESTYE